MKTSNHHGRKSERVLAWTGMIIQKSIRLVLCNRSITSIVVIMKTNSWGLSRKGRFDPLWQFTSCSDRAHQGSAGTSRKEREAWVYFIYSILWTQGKITILNGEMGITSWPSQIMFGSLQKPGLGAGAQVSEYVERLVCHTALLWVPLHFISSIVWILRNQMVQRYLGTYLSTLVLTLVPRMCQIFLYLCCTIFYAATLFSLFLKVLFVCAGNSNRKQHFILTCVKEQSCPLLSILHFSLEWFCKSRDLKIQPASVFSNPSPLK